MAKKISELMQRGAVTCTEDRSIREVAQIMVFNRLRYCVIVRDRNEVEGIISARSILKALGRNLDRTKAKDILLPYTITAAPSTPLTEAIQIMNERRIEHLVIVSDKPGSKAVLGILSAADIVQSMAKEREGKT
jgi:predicted transcriptional regulator